MLAFNELKNYIDRINVLRRAFDEAELIIPLSQTDVIDIAKCINVDLRPENLAQTSEMSLRPVHAETARLRKIYSQLQSYSSIQGIIILPGRFEVLS